MANPTLSPDGSRVALDISDQKANNVDILDLKYNRSGQLAVHFRPWQKKWWRCGREMEA